MTRTTSLPWPHALLALAVMAVWGTNFVVIRIALEHLPPLLLATLRFALVVAPVFMYPESRVTYPVSARSERMSTACSSSVPTTTGSCASLPPGRTSLALSFSAMTVSYALAGKFQRE